MFKEQNECISKLLSDDPVIDLSAVTFDDTMFELVIAKIKRTKITTLRLKFIKEYNDHYSRTLPLIEEKLKAILSNSDILQDLEVMELPFKVEHLAYTNSLNHDLETLEHIAKIVESSPRLKSINLSGHTIPEPYLTRILSRLKTYTELEQVSIKNSADLTHHLQILQATSNNPTKSVSLPDNFEVRDVGVYSADVIFMNCYNKLGHGNEQLVVTAGHVKYLKESNFPDKIAQALPYSQVWLSETSLLQYSTTRLEFTIKTEDKWVIAGSWCYKKIHFVINYNAGRIAVGANDSYIYFVYNSQNQSFVQSSSDKITVPTEFSIDELTMVPLLDGGALLLNIEFKQDFFGINYTHYNKSMFANDFKIHFTSICDLNVPIALDESRLIIDRFGMLQVYNIDRSETEQLICNWHIKPLWGQNHICSFNVDYPSYNPNISSYLDTIPISITVGFWKKNSNELQLIGSICLRAFPIHYAPVFTNNNQDILFATPEGLTRHNLAQALNPPETYLPTFKSKVLAIRKPLWQEKEDCVFEVKVEGKFADGKTYKATREKFLINLPLLPNLLPQTFETAFCKSRAEIYAELTKVHLDAILRSFIAPEIEYYISNAIAKQLPLPETLQRGYTHDALQFNAFCASIEAVKCYISNIVCKDSYVFGDLDVIRNTATSVLHVLATAFDKNFDIIFAPDTNMPELHVKSIVPGSSPYLLLGFKDFQYFRIGSFLADFARINQVKATARLWCDRYTISTETELHEILIIIAQLKKFVDSNPVHSEDFIFAEYSRILGVNSAEMPTLPELITTCMEWFLTINTLKRDRLYEWFHSPLIDSNAENKNWQAYHAWQEAFPGLIPAYYLLFKMIYQIKEYIPGINPYVLAQYNTMFMIVAKFIEDQTIGTGLFSSDHEALIAKFEQLEDQEDDEAKMAIFNAHLQEMSKNDEFITEPAKRSTPQCVIS